MKELQGKSFMKRMLTSWAGICLFVTLSSSFCLLAQTTCDDGNGALSSAQPQGITSQEIIQKTASKETVFKQARNGYSYTPDVTVPTVDGNTVNGEFRQVSDIAYSDTGA